MKKTYSKLKRFFDDEIFFTNKKCYRQIGKREQSFLIQQLQDPIWERLVSQLVAKLYYPSQTEKDLL